MSRHVWREDLQVLVPTAGLRDRFLDDVVGQMVGSDAAGQAQSQPAREPRILNQRRCQPTAELGDARLADEDAPTIRIQRL